MHKNKLTLAIKLEWYTKNKQTFTAIYLLCIKSGQFFIIFTVIQSHKDTALSARVLEIL